MNCLTALLSIFVLVLSLGASAQEKQSASRGESYANRQDKQFSVLGQITGISNGALSNQQVHFGYFLDPLSLVQLEIGQGSSGFGFLWTSSYRSLRTDSIGLQYKRFVANTFYFKTGAEYFVIDYNYSLSSSGNYTFKGNLLAASFSIGNQWQFETFTLGCDWVGILLPLSSNTTSDVVNSSSIYAREDSNSDQKRYLKDSSLQFVRFYLGASF